MTFECNTVAMRLYHLIIKYVNVNICPCSFLTFRFKIKSSKHSMSFEWALNEFWMYFLKIKHLTKWYSLTRGEFLSIMRANELSFESTEILKLLMNRSYNLIAGKDMTVQKYSQKDKDDLKSASLSILENNHLIHLRYFLEVIPY